MENGVAILWKNNLQLSPKSTCKKHTTRNTWSSKEIIETYLDQYAIESIFKDTKNPHHFAIHPQYHWTDQKVRVHTFYCLLGLLLTSLLKKELMFMLI